MTDSLMFASFLISPAGTVDLLNGLGKVYNTRRSSSMDAAESTFAFLPPLRHLLRLFLFVFLTRDGSETILDPPLDIKITLYHYCLRVLIDLLC
jgi:hypothetical protein